MAKYGKMFGEIENVISTNRGFHTRNHCVAIHEQTKKDSPTFILSKELSQMEFRLFP